MKYSKKLSTVVIGSASKTLLLWALVRQEHSLLATPYHLSSVQLFKKSKEMQRDKETAVAGCCGGLVTS